MASLISAFHSDLQQADLWLCFSVNPPQSAISENINFQVKNLFKSTEKKKGECALQNQNRTVPYQEGIFLPLNSQEPAMSLVCVMYYILQAVSQFVRKQREESSEYQSIRIPTGWRQEKFGIL